MELREFGPYRIEGLLGRGGMGVVYRAYDTEHRRQVALKVLAEDLAADPGYQERFRREAHTAARLTDPHIVPIHRYGETDGRLFLDMRLVRGSDLAAVLADSGPMAPARAVGIVSQVAAALDSAHADGLVHRDVKPSNVLVCAPATDTDGDEFVYLVDFGIAHPVVPDVAQPSLTQTGSAVGSFDYMAPERFLEGPADARTDVYALACVLFECLTGSRPFPVTGLAPLMYAHLNQAPPAPSSLRPGLPRALDEVVARGLAKDPADRWQSAGALAAAARRALTSPVRVPDRAPDTPPPTPLPPAPSHSSPSDSLPSPLPSRTDPGKRTSDRRGGSRLATVLTWTAAALVAALVGVLLLLRDEEPARDRPEPPTAGPRHDDLLAILPADYDPARCRPAPAADDGEVAAVDCGPSATRPGPGSSRFFLYPDAATLDEVFLEDVERVDLDEQPPGTSCPATQGHGVWEEDGVGSGRVACYVDAANDAVLIWTEDEDAVEAVVRIRGGGTQGLTELVDWWRDTDVAVFGD
ncbi:serine/threonine-protein kinase [Blastococcus sp. TF02A-26]|uniref:serine/threonine-protein kinase n=1 Tax=Blastococcus sp. TF02A-26 TaxID=2250577 RepID=UPI0018F6E753|nr:serine/threonine-protein kinase [Blastococcus sp. TF02A-26]